MKMEENITQYDRRYDFSTPESQYLLEQFSLLLDELIEEAEEREQYIRTLENPSRNSIVFFVKRKVIIPFIKRCYIICGKVLERLGLKDRLKNTRIAGWIKKALMRKRIISR
jgi:hypothetical protein